ncbi:hypothetical protein [Xanthomonas translucens]|nr:hypothetical protein [Xanthomonas translucens]ELQ13851.1 hypothetical protein A989_05362 [Xanthomonas translucens DAR61454]MCT8316404.1 hypothetical protein [Xanthomonas translucens pv. undulosa]WLA15675.1 hypothetical protein MO326_17510 [Xanthomonas translucens]
MTAASAKKSEDNTALRELSFTSLSAVMSRYLQITDQSRAGSVERWSLIIGLMGAGFGLLSGALLDGKAALVCTVTGLAIELLGFAVSAVLQVIREAPGFRHPYATHAQEMEQQFHHYQGIVTALRAFPLEHRRQRETFIRDRRTNMHERLGLFTGGMERLGVMPVLLALYLQFKDWRWGDWSALGKITAVQSVLAFLLLFSYALSWHLIRLRVRVQTYEQLLVEANRQDSAASG